MKDGQNKMPVIMWDCLAQSTELQCPCSNSALPVLARAGGRGRGGFRKFGSPLR